jgi:glutaredoxin 3
MSIFKNIAIVAVALALGLGAGYLYRNSPLGADESSGPRANLLKGDYSAIYASANAPVVIYTLKSCTACAQAKTLLKTHGIAFAERGLDDSKAFRQEAKSIGARRTPLLLIGDIGIEGFDEQKILDTLKKQGLVPP